MKNLSPYRIIPRRISPADLQSEILALRREEDLYFLKAINDSDKGLNQTLTYFFYLPLKRKISAYTVELNEGEKLPSLSGVCPTVVWEEAFLQAVEGIPISFSLRDQLLFWPHQDQGPMEEETVLRDRFEEAGTWKLFPSSLSSEAGSPLKIWAKWRRGIIQKIRLQSPPPPATILFDPKASSWEHLLPPSLVQRHPFSSAYVLGTILEKLMGSSRPIRAEALCLILLEWERILFHFRYLSKIFLNCHLDFWSEQFSEFSLEIQLLLQQMSPETEGKGPVVGARLLFPGGFKQDILPGWIAANYQMLGQVRKLIDSCKKEFFNTALSKQILGGGELGTEDLARLPIRGPNLRACGLNDDLRWIRPYGLYAELDFSPGLVLGGGHFQRTYVRFEEVQSSLSLIAQIVGNIPLGKINEEIHLSVSPTFSPPIPQGHHDYFGIDTYEGELGLFITQSLAGNWKFSWSDPAWPLLNTWEGAAREQERRDFDFMALTLGVPFTPALRGNPIKGLRPDLHVQPEISK